MTLPLLRTSGMIRAAMFYAFAQELRRLEATDVAPTSFVQVLREAIDDYGVEPGSISTTFRVTRPTVSRWKSGEATPGIYLRREVVSWIAARVETEATSLEPGRRTAVIHLFKVATTLDADPA